MKTLNPDTKKAQGYLDAYRRSRHTRLSDCYGSYSTDKARADKECRSWMEDEGGEGYRIISFCRNFFSVAWRNPDGALRVETPSSSYLIPVAL